MFYFDLFPPYCTSNINNEQRGGGGAARLFLFGLFYLFSRPRAGLASTV